MPDRHMLSNKSRCKDKACCILRQQVYGGRESQAYSRDARKACLEEGSMSYKCFGDICLHGTAYALSKLVKVVLLLSVAPQDAK